MKERVIKLLLLVFVLQLCALVLPRTGFPQELGTWLQFWALACVGFTGSIAIRL